MITIKTRKRNSLNIVTSWPGESSGLNMKMTSFRPWLLALILGLAVNTYAAPADLLRQAYGELASANHDYEGHRGGAMRQVEAAAKELGVNVHGDDKYHENQGVSDNHLRTAQSLLNQAGSGLSGKPLKHVLAAERQISIALSVK